MQKKPYWNITINNDYYNIDIPKKSQVVIIGAGLTGLSCALTLLRKNYEVSVIDAKGIANGCSGRSGGMLGTGHRLPYSTLRCRLGNEISKSIMNELHDSLQFTKNLINDNNLDADLDVNGRFRGVMTQKDIDNGMNNIEIMQKMTGEKIEFVKQQEIKNFINSDCYKGGFLYPEHGMVNPAKFAHSLAKKVINENGKIFTPVLVKNIKQNQDKKIIKTDKGDIICDILVCCTNGYTSKYSKYDIGYSSRISPALSTLIVSQKFDKKFIKKLIPKNTSNVELTTRYAYHRTTPCGERILIGGRTSFVNEKNKRIVGRMEKIANEIYNSALGENKIKAEYYWSGSLGMSCMQVPFIQSPSPNYYRVGGYSGSGMAAAPYMGDRLAKIIINKNKEQTIFTKTPAIIMPHFGDAWFIHPINAYYNFMDLFRK